MTMPVRAVAAACLAAGLAAAPALAQTPPLRLAPVQSSEGVQSADTVATITVGPGAAGRVLTEAVGNRLDVTAPAVDRLDGRQTNRARQSATTDLVVAGPLNGTLSVESRAIGNLLVWDQQGGPPPAGVFVQESFGTGLTQEATTRVRASGLGTASVSIGAYAAGNRVELPDRPDAIAPSVRQTAEGSARMSLDIGGVPGNRRLEQTTVSNATTVGASR